MTLTTERTETELPQERRLVTSVPGPKSQALLARKAEAVSAGVGSLVAVGAPTSLSARLAAERGLALWGFVRGQRAVRYC